MGGRGASSGMRGGNPNSPEGRNAYNIEMENARSFEAEFVLDSNTTKDAIGYQMYVHEDVTGRSLIADTRKEIEMDRRALKEANSMGKSYGMSNDAIAGMKKGIQEKISLKEKAIDKMQSAKEQYEKYKKQAFIGSEKSRRRKGSWM